MSIISVDKTKCITCAACVQVCPMGVLEMDLLIGSGCVPVEVSIPVAKHPEKCIKCGHCVAVCPTAALDNINAPLSTQVPFKESDIPDLDITEIFLRSRRSIRTYNENRIPQEKLKRLLNISRFAPSGTNVRGLSYIVVSDRKKLKRITEVIIDWLEAGLNKENSKMPKSFRAPVEQYRQNGKDSILRGAPHLILALSTPETLAVSVDSAKFALEYIELLGTSMGIGTCWMGLVQLCANRKYPPLMEVLGIMENNGTEVKKVVGAITAGYPRYKYHRLVDRDLPDIEWI